MSIQEQFDSYPECCETKKKHGKFLAYALLLSVLIGCAGETLTPHPDLQIVRPYITLGDKAIGGGDSACKHTKSIKATFPSEKSTAFFGEKASRQLPLSVGVLGYYESEDAKKINKKLPDKDRVRILDADYGFSAGGRVCNATVISSKYVITAKHCLNPKDKDSGTYLGHWKTVANGSGIEKRELTHKEMARFAYVQLGSDSQTGFTRLRVKRVVSDCITELNSTEKPKRDHYCDFAVLELDIKRKLSRRRIATPDFGTSFSGEMAILIHDDDKTVGFRTGIGTKDRDVIQHGTDTYSTSSGSGLFSKKGFLLGVHTTGGCDQRENVKEKTSNYGMSIDVAKAMMFDELSKQELCEIWPAYYPSLCGR